MVWITHMGDDGFKGSSIAGRGAECAGPVFIPAAKLGEATSQRQAKKLAGGHLFGFTARLAKN
jgi:hypothetical protein